MSPKTTRRALLASIAALASASRRLFGSRPTDPIEAMAAEVGLSPLPSLLRETEMFDWYLWQRVVTIVNPDGTTRYVQIQREPPRLKAIDTAATNR